MTEFLLGAAAITLIYQGIKLNQLTKQVNDIENSIIQNNTTEVENNRELHRRIDQEIDRNYRLHTDSIEYTNRRCDEKELLKG